MNKSNTSTVCSSVIYIWTTFVPRAQDMRETTTEKLKWLRKRLKNEQRPVSIIENIAFYSGAVGILIFFLQPYSAYNSTRAICCALGCECARSNGRQCNNSPWPGWIYWVNACESTHFLFIYGKPLEHTLHFFCVLYI